MDQIVAGSSESLRHKVAGVEAAVNEVILGKKGVIRETLTCMVAGGHLLLEDLPGVGKTTLAQALSRAFGLEYQRVQFTSDLLPADVLGVSVWRQDKGAFEFQEGPVFTQVLLADEVNRAPPKTQSALLEAMEEHQVSIDGRTRDLPKPFFVLATQNPQDAHGVFPLPESQLDRFLMRVSLGYPSEKAELEVLGGQDRRQLLQGLQAAMSPEELLQATAVVGKVTTTEALLAYVQALLGWSRESGQYLFGLSTRAGLALVQAARAWAWLENRDHVIPEDVQAVLPAVTGHRLQFAEGGTPVDPVEIVKPMREQVAIP